MYSVTQNEHFTQGTQINILQSSGHSDCLGQIRQVHAPWIFFVGQNRVVLYADINNPKITINLALPSSLHLNHKSLWEAKIVVSLPRSGIQV